MPRSRLAGSVRQNRRRCLFRGHVPIPSGWGHLAARCPHMSPLRDPFGLGTPCGKVSPHVPDAGSAHPLDQGYPARCYLPSLLAERGDPVNRRYGVGLTRCSVPRNDRKPIIPISWPVRAACSAAEEGRSRRSPRSGWAGGGAVWRIQRPPVCRGSSATRT